MFGRMVFAKSQSHSIVINLYFAEGCTVLLFVSLSVWVVLQTFCTQPIIAIVVLVGTLRVNLCLWDIGVVEQKLTSVFQYIYCHLRFSFCRGIYMTPRTKEIAVSFAESAYRGFVFQ